MSRRLTSVAPAGLLGAALLALPAGLAGAQAAHPTHPAHPAAHPATPAHPAQAAHAAPAGPYHVVKRLTVGGEGGWDYLMVDTAAHRLYVSRGTHVMVLDTDRDSLVGDITGTNGVHGIAIARDLGRGFTSNGRDSTVTVFDLGTLATVATIHMAARNPDAIMYEPVTHRVFTFNGGTSNATAIDARTDSVVGYVALGGKPEFAQHDGHGRVFVNNEDKGEIVAFDARTLAVQGHWAMAGCEEPSGLAIDRRHARLFAGCGNKVVSVVDYHTGKVVAQPPVGDGLDAAAFDSATSLVFTSNGADGTISVLHQDAPDRYSTVATVPTARGARTMALDPRTHKLYTVTAEFGPAPAPTPDRPRPRPAMVPGTFTIYVLDR